MGGKVTYGETMVIAANVENKAISTLKTVKVITGMMTAHEVAI